MSDARQTRNIRPFNDKLGIIPLGALDWAVLWLCLGWIALILAQWLAQSQTPTLYGMLREVHNHFGRFALLIALLMFGVSCYIGLLRSADVTPYFRRGTYVILGMMLMQAGLGAMMWLMGGRSGEDVHILYGLGAVLALPFFIFVERTAEKRPAMGSYMWGFALLAGVITRCLATGPTL